MLFSTQVNHVNVSPTNWNWVHSLFDHPGQSFSLSLCWPNSISRAMFTGISMGTQMVMIEIRE